MQKISPFLWFDHQAEGAANFYVSIFKNSKLGGKTYYDEESAKVSGMEAGFPMTIAFEIEGQHFTALNGGPYFKFSEAISFVVSCESQDELDYYWYKLAEGGDEKSQQCGWLKDKYGVSWQIVPTILNQMMMDTDRAKASRVMQALLPMKKIVIAELENAYQQ